MRKKLVAKLDKVFSEYIRLRYADAMGNTECVTCGKKDHWKKLQCGHFQSRKHYNTRWNEQNCQVQCASCNVFKYGEQYKFGQYINSVYGDGYADELERMAREIVKLSQDDFENMIAHYQEKVAEVRMEKNL